MHISAAKIVISTGSHAMTLDIAGVDSKDILTNETIFEQTEDIANMVVIGG
jgi:pyruvate/2-oxoglutarate dehydrogenase complex dihydrolipoamide dehydrogenase (E3) component